MPTSYEMVSSKSTKATKLAKPIETKQNLIGQIYEANPPNQIYFNKTNNQSYQNKTSKTYEIKSTKQYSSTNWKQKNLTVGSVVPGNVFNHQLAP